MTQIAISLVIINLEEKVTELGGKPHAAIMVTFFKCFCAPNSNHGVFLSKHAACYMLKHRERPVQRSDQTQEDEKLSNGENWVAILPSSASHLIAWNFNKSI